MVFVQYLRSGDNLETFLLMTGERVFSIRTAKETLNIKLCISGDSFFESTTKWLKLP